jgi:hypothetical protein
MRVRDARLVVHDAERADEFAAGRGNRVTDIKADVRLAQDVGIMGETLIDGGVGNDHLLLFENGVGTEGVFAPGFDQIEAVTGLEKLAVLVDQDDAGHRDVQDPGGETGDAVKSFFWWGIQKF